MWRSSLVVTWLAEPGPGPGPAAGQEEMMKIADSTHRHQQGGVLARSQTETTTIISL